MMGNIFAIRVEFATDIITNSSSELFVCNTDKTLEGIVEALQAMVDAYGKTEKRNYSFEGMFCDPVFAKDAPSWVASYIEYSIPWENPHDWREDRDKYYAYEQQKRDAFRSTLPEDFGDYILIHSADDNSIPYGIQEMIVDLFNARRVHLG